MDQRDFRYLKELDEVNKQFEYDMDRLYSKDPRRPPSPDNPWLNGMPPSPAIRKNWETSPYTRNYYSDRQRKYTDDYLALANRYGYSVPRTILDVLQFNENEMEAVDKGYKTFEEALIAIRKHRVFGNANSGAVTPTTHGFGEDVQGLRRDLQHSELIGELLNIQDLLIMDRLQLR
ncbi:MAG: hypothetical protein NPIRA04_20460 [Nitrospirales bacterium]|nr:MAG: hypothetical protein NPIRA04_20460 [Nitrospirales bacterium]